MASGPITSWQIDGETVETRGWLYFGGLQNHCGWWLKPWNQKTLAPWKESYDQPRQHIQKQRHYFANKGLLVKAMVFPVSCMDVRVGLWRRLSTNELMLLNCGVGDKSLQLCPTLRDPMDYSLPGSSTHGIFQARVLEWGAIAFFGRGTKEPQWKWKRRVKKLA